MQVTPFSIARRLRLWISALVLIAVTYGITTGFPDHARFNAREHLGSSTWRPLSWQLHRSRVGDSLQYSDAENAGIPSGTWPTAVASDSIAPSPSQQLSILPVSAANGVPAGTGFPIGEPASPSLDVEDAVTFGPGSDSRSTSPAPTNNTSQSPPAPSLPADYQERPLEGTWCSERFGLDYLSRLAESMTSYCDPDDSDSNSNFQCFHSQTASEGRIDSFCVGGPASFNEQTLKFDQKCRNLNLQGYGIKSIPVGSRLGSSEADGQVSLGGLDGVRPAPSLGELAKYYTGKGPQTIIDRHLSLASEPPVESGLPSGNWTVLLIRDSSLTNFWHSIMDAFSLSMTFDVLRMVQDPATGRPIYTDKDMENTQVVIVDHEPSITPTHELLNLVAKKPTINMNSSSDLASIQSDRIIVPLAGNGNPFWQGDWLPHSCTQSALLSTFVHRITRFYDLPDPSLPQSPPLSPPPPQAKGQPPILRITILNRTGSRRLRDLPAHITHLQSVFPSAEITLIDLATLSLRDQIALIQNTDVLVGVHGAGLTHLIFLPPGSAVVEIEPQELDFKGFRNLAHLRGLLYVTGHSRVDEEEEVTGDWHFDHVVLETEKFVDLVGVAVKGIYNSGVRSADVIQ